MNRREFLKAAAAVSVTLAVGVTTAKQAIRSKWYLSEVRYYSERKSDAFLMQLAEGLQ